MQFLELSTHRSAGRTGADLGDLTDDVRGQSGAGDVLQFTPADGRDEVQVVGLIQLVPQVLQWNTDRS